MNHRLSLTARKSEVVVLTRQRHFGKPLSFDIMGEMAEVVKTVKYLGETVD